MTADAGEPGLAPVADADWPAEIAPLRQTAGRLNVYRVMAHHPPLLAAWQSLRDHVVLRSSLPGPLLELAILRVGHRLPGFCSGSRGTVLCQRTRQQFAPPDAGTSGPRR